MDTGLVGSLLEKRYRIEDRLGRGGFAVAYLAFDERVGRKVVVKVPHPQTLDDPVVRRRFEVEIESLSRLSHPNVVKVLDASLPGADPPFYSLEYMEGGSLRDRMDEGRAERTVHGVLKWLPTVADALDGVFREGIVHRDVKPGNILFDRYDHAYLADFGIAKLLGPSAPELTASAELPPMTPAYMAPEWGGNMEPSRTYDEYGLATMVYEVLAETFPFRGDSAVELLYERLRSDPIPLTGVVPGIPAEVDRVILKALSRDPDERYEGSTEFARAFAAAVEGCGRDEATQEIAVPDVRSTAPAGPRTKNLYVPQDFPTIQLALDTAGRGDIVLVEAGDYSESLELKDGVQLIGVDRGEVVLHPVPRGSALAVAAGCRGGRIEGFTFDPAGAAAGRLPHLGLACRTQPDAVWVSEVEEGSPAARAGLAEGDRILEVEGRTVESSDALHHLLALRGVARRLVVVVYRDGVRHRLRLRTKPWAVPGRWPDGLVIVDSRIEVKDCDFRKVPGVGILVVGAGSEPELRGNEITGCGTGIRFAAGARGLAASNRCLEGEGNGIEAIGRGTAPALAENTCRKNRGSGLLVHSGASARAEANDCAENAVCGIRVVGAGTHAEVSENACVGNAGFGLVFGEGASGRATSNLCRENREGGISVEGVGTAPSLVKNEVAENRRFGILLGSGIRGVAAENKVVRNRGYGLYARPGAGMLVRQNRSRDNRKRDFGGKGYLS